MADEPKITVEGNLEESAFGGGYTAGTNRARELSSWRAPIVSADMEINRDKPVLDARVKDMVRNEGYMQGAVDVHRDSIVGAQYVLNAQPNYKVLGADEKWSEEFQEAAEAKFHLWAESSDHWPDVSRTNTLTGLVRLAVGVSVYSGEVLALARWSRKNGARRPFNTAIQMVDVDRLSNPYNQSDTQTLRRGVEKDSDGAALAYHIRKLHPSESFISPDIFTWQRVPATKPWGRKQVLHVFEQNRPDQSRGVSPVVSVLKEMRMTKSFRDVTLQNAVLNASYAAAIESELPTDLIWEQMGGGAGGADNAVTQYMNQLAEYVGESRSLNLDGVKIPHLFPGTKLNFKPAATQGGVGMEFEQSLLRYLASALGLSYEQFSRDYTKTNYSSARASILETWKYMQARKKMFADRFASFVYELWLEEAVAKGEVPLPAGKDRNWFYEGLNKEALSRCEWIGAARGQIDELKETQAAVMRIEKGLSTYEDEIARTGKDFRVIFRQRAREEKMKKDLDLDFSAAPAVGGGNAAAAPGKSSAGQNNDSGDDL